MMFMHPALVAGFFVPGIAAAAAPYGAVSP